MFSTDMAEARNNRVVIDDFDSNVIEQLVRYIQTSKIDESIEASAHNLLLIADKYDVRGLKDLAQNQLIKSLGFETVCDTFEFATMIADTEALRTACSKFICDNRDAVKSKGDWRKLGESAKEQRLDVLL